MKIDIVDFKEHSEFKTLKEYNTNIEMFLASHKRDFTATEYILFKRFIKIACNTKKRVYGVSYASINYIMKQVNELDLPLTGCSETTFHRMKRKCIKLGILEIKTRVRNNNSQTTNLWIIKKFRNAKIVEEKTTNVTPRVNEEQAKPAPAKEKEVKQMAPHNTINLSNTNNHLNIRTENENSHIIRNKALDETYISKDIPKPFVKLATCYYNDPEIVEELWKMVKIAEKKANYIIEEFDLVHVAKDAFKQTIKSLKARKIKKNIFAFFYGAMEKMLSDLYEEFYKPEEPFFEFPNLISMAAKPTPEELNADGVY